MRPEARAICGRCGGVFDHAALKAQVKQVAAGMKGTLLLVCPRCYDLPAAFLRVLPLPRDPENVPFPSPETYTIDGPTH